MTQTGAVALALILGVGTFAQAQTPPDVQVLVNGSPAALGAYAFPSAVDALVLDNGLIRFTFTRDDAAGGIVTG